MSVSPFPANGAFDPENRPSRRMWTMRDITVWRSPQWLPWVTVGIFVAGMLGRPAVVAGAAIDPPPDPAGIATGDRATVVDAAGNSFVVSEPTDRADPD